MSTTMVDAVGADSNEADFPAVDAAYGFVIPSYQLLVNRFEAADARLTSLLTLTFTLTLGAPVFAKSLRPDIAFSDPFFIGGLAFAATCVFFGIWGRVTGHIILPDPMVIYSKSLRRQAHSFKMSQIYFAGENFDKNAQAIDLKGVYSTVMTIAICLEVACFVVWLSH